MNRIFKQSQRIEVLEARLAAQDEIIKVAKEQLGNISSYDTCHTCDHYLGRSDKYCLFENCADKGGRPDFKPTNRYQVRALETLAKIAELEKGVEDVRQ